MKIGKLSSELLGLIFFFLNVFAGIIGGVWLLLEGEWRIVIYGFIAFLAMPHVWWIFGLPSLGITVLMEKFYNSKFWWLSLGFVNSLYSSLTFSLWVVTVYFAFSTGFGDFAKPESLAMSIPGALMGYSVAISPIAYIVSHDPPDAIGAHSKRFVSQVEYILLFVLNSCGINIAILLLLSPVLIVVLIVSEAILLTLLSRALWQEELAEESDYE